MELTTGLDVKLVTVDADKIAEIAKDQPYFVAMDIPVDTYGNERSNPYSGNHECTWL